MIRSLSVLLALSIACDDDVDSAAEADNSPYGPDNAWWHAAATDVPPGLAGTGWEVGDTAYNFTLVDQNSDEVELYQFFGRIVMLDLFMSWCWGCQDDAPNLQTCWERQGDDGAIILGVMFDGDDDGTLDAWMSEYGITYPMMTDPTNSLRAGRTTGIRPARSSGRARSSRTST